MDLGAVLLNILEIGACLVLGFFNKNSKEENKKYIDTELFQCLVNPQ